MVIYIIKQEKRSDLNKKIRKLCSKSLDAFIIFYDCSDSSRKLFTESLKRKSFRIAKLWMSDVMSIVPFFLFTLPHYLFMLTHFRNESMTRRFTNLYSRTFLTSSTYVTVLLVTKMGVT